MKSYHFDCGNSSRGPIGFCARIRAESQDEALGILKDALPQEMDVSPVGDRDLSAHVEYIQIYLSSENIRTRHIDEWEDVK